MTAAIASPLAGWATPLGEVPDPVFADRMLGDGVAIDPVEGLVSAPCDGIVAAVAPTRHSVTIEADGGATLLIHVGLDTVALKGEGFELLVEMRARKQWREIPVLVITAKDLTAQERLQLDLGARQVLQKGPRDETLQHVLQALAQCTRPQEAGAR